MPTYVHDPTSELDYGFNWAPWLAVGETIITSTWTIDAGLTKISDSKSNTATVVWIKGGTVGMDYTITNHIVTSVGRKDPRSHTLMVRAR
jgi:hypothetical protein